MSRQFPKTGRRPFLVITVLLCAAPMVYFARTRADAARLFAGAFPSVSRSSHPRQLSFAERVAYQRAIEEVHWQHRIWPAERPDPKPALDEALPVISGAPMGQDIFVARSCTDDTWNATATINAPAARYAHTAVWTGGEMIVWGGSATGFLNTGGRYNPSTDTWTATSTTNAPAARRFHTAIWTGTEMIVWGGRDSNFNFLNTGGRYNPASDSWTPTSTTNAPSAREVAKAVWTGSEMIVWGGSTTGFLNTGGRYNPSTDTWTTTSTTNAPAARNGHTAVWTGSEMLIWGGQNGSGFLNTGGRYNPGADSWTIITTTNAPTARDGHTAVWTGSQMIVWGGLDDRFNRLNTGGRYNPATDAWTATSTTNAPVVRDAHTAIWTGSQMIVWGGDGNTSFLNTGGRYNPSTDAWTATSTTNAPAVRDAQTAIWTGSQMIVWGGLDNSNNALNTGGRYCAQVAASPTPTPTPTPTPNSTPTPAPTPASTPTPTPNSTPTPAPTPTPTPTAVGAMVQFSSPNYTVNEGRVTATITVSRSGDTSSNVTVDYATNDGAALQRIDYTTATGTITFAPGVTGQTFPVLITKNGYIQGPQTVNLALSNPTGGATLGAPDTATLAINDDTSMPASAQPIDDAATFVCQHYHDFLGREPDSIGFAYWTGQITQCAGDQNCIRNERVAVSNAFFYELEFQQTGSYVYRLYRAAYGNNQPFPNPDNSNQTEAEKLPSYAVFTQDRGRVVGGAELASGQQALANVFVQRPEFLAKYPASLDGSSFIDAVLENIRNDIGVRLTSQKSNLLALFNSGGRGAVMYRLADDNVSTNPIDNRAFIDAEYNRAFVITQYFGYLRRDADIGGFLFWLGQVGNCPLRNVGAQHAMVCSFITSAEYQNRFSSAVTHTNQECSQIGACSSPSWSSTRPQPRKLSTTACCLVTD